MHKILKGLPLRELRQIWANEWGKKPHARIGRSMLEKSLEYKQQENINNNFFVEKEGQLSKLVKQYKSNPSSFEKNTTLKPGTRLIRMHDGKKHAVLVKTHGFEYAGKNYESLSKIAHDITGKKWNGWVFFGLKNAGAK